MIENIDPAKFQALFDYLTVVFAIVWALVAVAGDAYSYDRALVRQMADEKTHLIGRADRHVKAVFSAKLLANVLASITFVAATISYTSKIFSFPI